MILAPSITMISSAATTTSTNALSGFKWRGLQDTHWLLEVPLSETVVGSGIGQYGVLLVLFGGLPLKITVLADALMRVPMIKVPSVESGRTIQ
jgi:hypothetical protein